MIIFLFEGASPQQVNNLISTLREFGLHGHRSTFNAQPVILTLADRTDGDLDDIDLQRKLRAEFEIEKIIALPTPYLLANRALRPEGSVVSTGGFSVGNGSFGIIAGPCTVESERQMLDTALAVKKAGGTALRGGAFKPRTSPYAFQGLKEEGLKILAKARQETGLAIVTEAMAPDEVGLVEEYGDVIQIGARNAQNYRLLEAAGRVRKPILLKRGFSTTLDEWLMSAEYIMAGGNEQVILCERGIRTFETYTRFTLPVAVIPAMKRLTHLPIVVDPSHAAGRSEFVPPLAAASAAAGADGLLVEVHVDPKHALCDGRQSLTPAEFQRMVEQCNAIGKIVRDTPPHP